MQGNLADRRLEGGQRGGIVLGYLEVKVLNQSAGLVSKS